MTNVVWLDFNDAPDQSASPKQKVSCQEVRDEVLNQLPSVLSYLFPVGKQRHQQFLVGDIEGNAGKSLVVELEGVGA